MTNKQQKFIIEYGISGNATQAAIKAGYSKKTAYSIGQELLKKPEIINALQKTVDKRIATREERQIFWTEIMKDESQDVKHRLRASELLGKSQADFTEKVETNIKPTTLTDFILEAYARP